VDDRLDIFLSLSDTDTLNTDIVEAFLITLKL